MLLRKAYHRILAVHNAREIVEKILRKNTTTILDLIKNIDTESVDCMVLAIYKNCVISSNMYLYSRPAL